VTSIESGDRRRKGRAEARVREIEILERRLREELDEIA
jgi:hypothetical protein